MDLAIPLNQVDQAKQYSLHIIVSGNADKGHFKIDEMTLEKAEGKEANSV